ncbi:hypothetical protein NSMM_820025 [Nitrosomonas mobilis]|uniref:Uncharacterized protein n=1 Tax=Nitrosomonas mobilis TaxID=51642 RepID=A0A1G5SJ77_9PROT|nr:hypothetical protein NSMM_820025 [Nitrosomonas mobilis]
MQIPLKPSNAPLPLFLVLCTECYGQFVAVQLLLHAEQLAAAISKNTLLTQSDEKLGFDQQMISNKYTLYFLLKSKNEIIAEFVNGGLQSMLSNVRLGVIPLPLPSL